METLQGKRAGRTLRDQNPGIITRATQDRAALSLPGSALLKPLQPDRLQKGRAGSQPEGPRALPAVSVFAGMYSTHSQRAGG